jgi:hypothetical protein
MGKNYDRIITITIKQIVEEAKRLEIPMSVDVLKAAQHGNQRVATLPSLNCTGPSSLLATNASPR